MTAPMQIKRYPVRGALYGVLLGLGIAIHLLIFSIITFGDWVSTIVTVAAGVVVGVLWAMFAPARKPKGAPRIQVGGGYVPPGRPIATPPNPAAPPPAPAAPPRTPAAPPPSGGGSHDTVVARPDEPAAPDDGDRGQGRRI